MVDKQLKEKAIDIKGKKYVLVADRIGYFSDNYPEGMIRTKMISQPGATMVIIRARVYPDWKQAGRFYEAHSQAEWGKGMVNTTSALENAETSAVGRALALMGIGVIESVASADEMNKTTYYAGKRIVLKRTLPEDEDIPF